MVHSRDNNADLPIKGEGQEALIDVSKTRPSVVCCFCMCSVEDGSCGSALPC